MEGACRWNIARRLPWMLPAMIAACPACGSSGAEDASGIPVTVTTRTDPAFLRFRDGPDAPWKVPARLGERRYEIRVNGPYVVAAVCELTVGSTTTFAESARTLDDPHELQMYCPIDV